MFNTRQMEYFLAIAEEKSLTRAAERLYISESALSQFLNKLSQSGLPKLFLYTGGEMTLTDAGKIYLNGVRTILKIRQDAMRRMLSPEQAVYPPLRIALLQSLHPVFYQTILPAFKQEFPSVLVDIRTLSYMNISEMLEENKIDMVIYGDMVKECPPSSIILAQRELVLLVPDNGDAHSLPIALPQATSNFYSLQATALRHWEIANPVYAYCNDMDEAFHLVEKGCCMIVADRTAAFTGRKGIHVEEQGKPVFYSLIAKYRPYQDTSLPMLKLIQLLKNADL